MVREYPRPGEVLIVGRKIYATCGNCDALVCINKPFFGGLHICATEAEIAARRRLNPYTAQFRVPRGTKT